MSIKSIVIIDSNIWISFMIGKTILKLKERIVEGRIQIILSDHLLEEIKEVLPRERFRKYFNDSDITDFLNYLKTISKKYAINSQVNICRDEGDNFLFSLAQDSNADYIVTGDKDLLVHERFGKTEIIRFRKFNELFQNLATD